MACAAIDAAKAAGVPHLVVLSVPAVIAASELLFKAQWTTIEKKVGATRLSRSASRHASSSLQRMMRRFTVHARSPTIEGADLTAHLLPTIYVSPPPPTPDPPPSRRRLIPGSSTRSCGSQWSVQEVSATRRSHARTVARFSPTLTRRGCTLVVRGTLVTKCDNWTVARGCFRGPTLVPLTPVVHTLTSTAWPPVRLISMLE